MENQLPGWLTIELALLPVAVMVISFLALMWRDLHSLKLWAQQHQEDSTNAVRDLNTVKNDVSYIKGHIGLNGKKR